MRATDSFNKKKDMRDISGLKDMKGRHEEDSFNKFSKHFLRA
jgi:hypothetical protein